MICSTIFTESDSDEDGIGTDDDSFEWTESPAGPPEWDPSGSVLSATRKEYIDQLVSKFNLTRQGFTSHATTERGSPSSSRASGSGTGRKLSESSKPPQKHCLKRKRSESDNNRDSSGGDDGKDSGPQSSTDNSKLFACPFVKRNPLRYRRCYGHRMGNVARVKYHLFRTTYHRIPIYCPRCSETFENESVRDEHVRLGTCSLGEPRRWEGISANQREQLNKRSSSKNTPEQNWFNVYKILFPDEPLPSSPYVDVSLSRELCAFREYELSEGSRIWDELLRTRLPEHLRSYREDVQSLYRSMFLDAVELIYESWMSRNATAEDHRSRSSQSTPIRIQDDSANASRENLEIDAPETAERADLAVGGIVPGSSPNGHGVVMFTSAQSSQSPAPHHSSPFPAPAATDAPSLQTSVDSTAANAAGMNTDNTNQRPFRLQSIEQHHDSDGGILTGSLYDCGYTDSNNLYQLPSLDFYQELIDTYSPQQPFFIPMPEPSATTEHQFRAVTP